MKRNFFPKPTDDSFFYAPMLGKKSKKQFYSTVSHMFRNPLVGAEGYIDCLFKGYAGFLKSQQLKQLALARESILMLAKTIDAFLDIIAFDLELIKVSGKKADISSEIKDIVLNIKEIFPKNKFFIDFPYKNRPFADIDPHWFNTMFYELLLNILRLSPAKTRININISEHKNNILIKIFHSGKNVFLADSSGNGRMFYSSLAFNSDNVLKRNGLSFILINKILKACKGKIKTAKNKIIVELKSKTPCK